MQYLYIYIYVQKKTLTDICTFNKGLYEFKLLTSTEHHSLFVIVRSLCSKLLLNSNECITQSLIITIQSLSPWLNRYDPSLRDSYQDQSEPTSWVIPEPVNFFL